MSTWWVGTVGKMELRASAKRGEIVDLRSTSSSFPHSRLESQTLGYIRRMIKAKAPLFYILTM